jgi:hypothetical protein
MPHWQMYQKPKYGQNDTVWVERGAQGALWVTCAFTIEDEPGMRGG